VASCADVADGVAGAGGEAKAKVASSSTISGRDGWRLAACARRLVAVARSRSAWSRSGTLLGQESGG